MTMLSRIRQKGAKQMTHHDKTIVRELAKRYMEMASSEKQQKMTS